MEAIAFVLGFVVLGALAVRFGQDSREGIHSKEHEFAAHGVTWTDLATDRPAPKPAAASPNPKPVCPTLDFIERALATAAGTLTASPDAARLEARAQELAADYWSDAVWTTGVIPAAAFRRVLAELAPGLAGAPVLTVEIPITAVEPECLAPAAAGREQPLDALERAPSLGLAGSPATV